LEIHRIDQDQGLGFLRQKNIIDLVFKAIDINGFHDRMLRDIVLGLKRTTEGFLE